MNVILRRVRSYDVYGQPVLSAAKTEPLVGIVKLRREAQHTTVRADSSQSRGHADEFVATTKFLLVPRTAAEIGDQLEFGGVRVKITTKWAQYDTAGRIDHYEVTGELWA
jgi:hypothetical protein